MVLTRMKELRWVLPLSLVCASVACSGGANADFGSSAEMLAGEGAEVEGGHIAKLGDILHAMALRPDQRAAVDQLLTDARARHEPVRASRVALRNQLATQVAAGNVDPATAADSIDRLGTLVEQIANEDRNSLQALHDLLDSAQRTQLVQSVRDALEKHHGGHHFGMRLKMWGEALSLTDAQKGQIRGQIQELSQKSRPGDPPLAMHGSIHGAIRDRMQQIIERFPRDDFRVDTSMSEPWSKARVIEHATKMWAFAQKVVPILTPEQRGKGADHLRHLGS